MRRILMSALVLMLPLLAKAQTPIAFTGTDIYGLNIRALTMGNAFTAVAKTGRTAMIYNPAGLATTYPADWGFSLSLGTDLAVATSALKFADDANTLKGTDAEKIDEFVDKYSKETITLEGQTSTDLAYQQQIASKGINRFGLGVQLGNSLQTLVSFPQNDAPPIDINQSAQQVTNQVEDILKDNYGINLTPAERRRLLGEIRKIKNQGATAQQEKIFNNLVRQQFNSQLITGSTKAVGGAVSAMDEKLKLGLSIRSYRLSSRLLNNYPLAKAVANEEAIEKIAPEKQASRLGTDLGILYSLEQFFLPDWEPQLGVAWQNFGGVDFGKEVNVKIVDTLNVGMSAKKELGPTHLIVAADLKDITGNYYRLNQGKKKKRSFVQRLHFGAELGIGEAAIMENRYFYVRAGLNQGQFTWGVEASLPYNILQVGYGNYSVDLGDESDRDIVEQQIVYISLGMVI